jgi:hypothetical protein
VGPVDTPQLYRVHDIIKYNGELIIGGEFDSARIGIDRVAALRNGYWEEMGGGIGHYRPIIAWETGVHLLEQVNGTLIAGGYFFDLFKMAYLLRWDGNDWVQFSDSAGGGYGVNSSTWYQGELYLGGEVGFGSSPWLEEGSVARWDGTHLYLPGRSLGYRTDIEGSGVHALTANEEHLYAGGTFDFLRMPYDPNPHHVAYWNGHKWDSLPERLNDKVESMAWFQGELFVGGVFTQAGVQSVGKLIKWNGSEWTEPAGAHFMGTVPTMAVYDRKLYAYAWAKLANGDTLGPGILSYDGNKWKLAADVSSVYKLRVVDSTLYAVGTFTSINGVRVNSVASYRSPTVSIEDDNPSFVVKNYPNPIKDQLIVEIPKAFLRQPARLKLLDIRGANLYAQAISETKSSHKLSFLPSGTYILDVHCPPYSYRSLIYKL